MAVVGLRAADEGVEAVDSMDQALGHQELEGAVHRWRLRRAHRIAERREQIIGLDRPMAAPDQLQHPAPQRGEPNAALSAHVIGAGERVLDTGLVARARPSWKAGLSPRAVFIRTSITPPAAVTRDGGSTLHYSIAAVDCSATSRACRRRQRAQIDTVLR